MKKFSAFFAEARDRSQAAQQAEKLQLTHVGYGKYADVKGNVTHMSSGGKLIPLDKKEVGVAEPYLSIELNKSITLASYTVISSKANT